MYALQSREQIARMPTKLKRISVALDDESYAKLEELALSSKRSVANMAAVLIDAALFPGGRIVAPKEDRRGGKRANSGRPKKNEARSTVEENADRASEN